MVVVHRQSVRSGEEHLAANEAPDVPPDVPPDHADAEALPPEVEHHPPRFRVGPDEAVGPEESPAGDRNLQVDEGGGRMLRRKIEALGVRVHTGKNTKNIVAGVDARHCMHFSDGTSLEGSGVRYLRLGQRVVFDLAEEGGRQVARNLKIISFS